MYILSPENHSTNNKHVRTMLDLCQFYHVQQIPSKWDISFNMGHFQQIGTFSNKSGHSTKTQSHDQTSKFELYCTKMFKMCLDTATNEPTSWMFLLI